MYIEYIPGKTKKQQMQYHNLPTKGIKKLHLIPQMKWKLCQNNSFVY